MRVSRYGDADGKNLNFGGSMEGALKWTAGAFVNGGYHFWLSQKNPVPVTVQVTGTIDVPVHCGGPNGPLARCTITVPVSIPPFTIPANSTAKYLTGGSEQHPVLDGCGGFAGSVCRWVDVQPRGRDVQRDRELERSHRGDQLPVALPDPGCEEQAEHELHGRERSEP